MDAVLKAVDLVVGEPPSPSVSLSVRRGEILGLLFPPRRPRMPLLRALTGVEPSRSGSVLHPGKVPHVALVGSRSLSDAFESQPDLLLVDGTFDAALEPEPEGRAFWARLAAERECGTAIILATESEEQAYRSDRVTLAMWDGLDVTKALEGLSRRMHRLTIEFLRLIERSEVVPTAMVAVILRRLNRAAKDLLAEGRRLIRDSEQVVEMARLASDLAADSVDDSVLETMILREQDN
jgi:hypothetical protein